MSLSCDKVHAFADGELDEADASRFRDHLATCEACAAELHAHMMLEAIAPKPPSASNVRSIDAARRTRRLGLGFLSILLPAAAAAWILHGGSVSKKPEPLASLDTPVLEVAATRSIEVRLAYPAADRYRAYDVSRESNRRPHEAVPLASLAALEAKGDVHGVGAGLALSGDLERASQSLDRAGEALDVAADRAALTLARGNADEALEALDAILSKSPSHPQAMWNRALALGDLGLPRASAEAFDRVAALAEPGWSDEARARAAALHAENDARDAAYRAAKEAGQSMAQGGPILGDSALRAAPETARYYFNHALHAAPTAERVRALEPLAQALDARAGGHVLMDAVKRTSARDFARRAPLAATYARLVASPSALDAAEAPRYLASLRAAGEVDMLLGATPLLDAVEDDIVAYEHLAAQSRDPWYMALAVRGRGDERRAAGDFASAEETLRRGLAACAPAHVDYACGRVAYSLAKLLVSVGRTTDARAVAVAALATTRASPSDLEAFFVFLLGDIAQTESHAPLVRAFMREAELTAPDDCVVSRSVHEELATAHILGLDAAAAVSELAKVPRCTDPMTLVMADAMVDAMRMGQQPAGRETFARDLEARRAISEPGYRAFADVIAARFHFATDPAMGEHLAKRALDDASHLPPSDTEARRAETYAHLTLAVESARAGKSEEALTEIVKGVHADPTTGNAACALGVAIDDDRALSVTRDASGSTVAELTAHTSPALSPASVVPASARARLQGCSAVRVFALPPLHGIPALLPSEIAWSYVSNAHASSKEATTPHRLVVSDVVPPPSLGLPPLRGWTSPTADATWLHGNAATPSRVLSEAEDATEIELHVHGFVDTAQTTASLLALSPDAEGHYALTAADLAKVHFRAHPVVVLGACHASHNAGSLHEPWNLPVAFIRAGARAVFASPSVIRDAEAAPFFDAVLARVRAGAEPAIALRDERATWLARDASSWVRDVIDFE